MYFFYFIQNGKYRQILVTVSDIKFYYNPSSGNRSLPRGKEELTDGYNKANTFFRNCLATAPKEITHIREIKIAPQH